MVIPLRHISKLLHPNVSQESQKISRINCNLQRSCSCWKSNCWNDFKLRGAKVVMEVTKQYNLTTSNESEDYKHIREVHVTVVETVDQQYGLFTWPSAPILAQFLLYKQTTIRNKYLLELGCGTALPGIVAAKLGAHVTLSDGHAFANCHRNCMKSVRANKVECAWVPITWGRVTEELVKLPPFQFIVASDCFYEKTDFPDIMFTVAYLLDQNPGAVFWTTYQLRDCDYSIELLLLKWGLSSREVLLTEFMDDENLDLSSSHDVKLFEIKKGVY